MSNMEEHQHNEIMIVIMVADIESGDKEFVLNQLKDNFSDLIESGHIHVIAPPAELYHNFKVSLNAIKNMPISKEWKRK